MAMTTTITGSENLQYTMPQLLSTGKSKMVSLQYHIVSDSLRVLFVAGEVFDKIKCRYV